jgi:hypothetical protein
MQRPLILFSFALAAVALACGGDKGTTPPPVSKIITFTGDLKSSNENPTNTSQGTGTFTITLDTSTNLLTWDVQVNGLTTNINNGHIHGPAAAGVNAGVILNFNPAASSGIPGSTFSGFGTTAGRAQGSLTLTSAVVFRTDANGDSLKKWLLNGQAYVNVHTTQNPGGEVRGQVVKLP